MKNFKLFLLLVLIFQGCSFNVENSLYSDEKDPFALLSDVANLNGEYINKGVANRNFDYDMPTNSLWFFITRKKTKCSKDAVVEIQKLSDELLNLKLKEGKTILDEMEIKSSKNFEIKDGHIQLNSESGSSSDGFGAGIGTSSFNLYLTKDGDLAGQISTYSMGLLFYFIPAGGVGKNWNRWEKLHNNRLHTEAEKARLR